MRRKVEIKLINEKSKRHTTFTKRRQGLIKKTKELCDLCDAVAAVIVFSDAGNAFFFGHPDVEEIVDQYLADHSSTLTTEGESSGASGAAEVALTKAEERLGEAIRSRRFDFEDEDLGIYEVDEIAAAMKELNAMLAARKESAAAAENIPVFGESNRG